MSRGAPEWVAEGVSRRGSSHERTGAPNQDAYAVQRVGSSVVAAVADGHGGRRYVRSQVGSALAVRLAAEIGAELLSTRRPDASEAARALPARLLPAWRAAVDTHYHQNPLTPDETERAGTEQLDPAILYGATLIVALAAHDVVAVAQIGDGSALGAAPHGVEHLVPGDDRLVANETTSLCLPNALADFRWGTGHFETGSAVLLSTDGYGNSFASEGWEEEVMSDLVTELDSHGFEEVAASMGSWAGDSAAVGGDDVTLVLLSRTLPARTARAPGRRAWGGLAVLAAAAAIAVTLGTRDDTTTPRETPVVATTTPAATPTSATPTSTTPPSTRATSSSTSPDQQPAPGSSPEPSGVKSTPKGTRS